MPLAKPVGHIASHINTLLLGILGVLIEIKVAGLYTLRISSVVFFSKNFLKMCEKNYVRVQKWVKIENVNFGLC